MKYFLLLCLVMGSLFGKIENFKTIQSDFTQKVTNEQNQTIVYSGKFYATQHKEALWIYEKPIAKKIYFQNTQVLIIEPELEQVIITTLENTPNMALLIQEAKEVSPNKHITKYMDTTYTIFTNKESIEKITYKDKLENLVEIFFTNQSINLFLDDVLFQAQIPKGYDVIRE